MQINRTKNSLLNMIWGFLQKIITLGGPFVVRTVLIYQLSAEYSGLNSLFSAVLQILSLTELGFSNAIVYSMYKPIAEDDNNAICALLNLYKKAYRLIGMIIMVIGVGIMPFLKLLIKDDVPADINIYVLYSVFMLNTVISYFMFAYKQSLLSAHQREDVVSRNSIIVNLFTYVLQLLVIVLFKNYYIYVIILPVSTVLMNVLNSHAVDKLYPDLKPHGIVDKETKAELKKRLIGLMIWKIGGATRNTLDSIVVSMFLGLTMVTIYNNYYYIINAIVGFSTILCTSITAGVGNKVATESAEVNYRDFNKFNMIYLLITSVATVCLLCLYQPFMNLWMGKDMMLSNLSVILFSLYFFIMKSGDINSVYYQSAGLWWEGKFRSLIEAVLNLVLNLSLGYFFGVNGIIAATIISMICIWPYASSIVFRKYFTGHRFSEYFLQTLCYLFILVLVGGTLFVVSFMISFGESKLMLLLELCIKLLICMASTILFWLFYRKMKYYSDAKTFTISLINRIKHRH